MSNTSGSFLLDQSRMDVLERNLGIYSRQNSKQDLCATRNASRKWLTINFNPQKSCLLNRQKHPSPHPVIPSVCLAPARLAVIAGRIWLMPAQTLVAQSSSGASTKETLAKVEALLAPLGVLETFRAYPGEAMMSALKEALARSDYSSFLETNEPHRQGHHHWIVSSFRECLEGGRGRRDGTERSSDERLF